MTLLLKLFYCQIGHTTLDNTPCPLHFRVKATKRNWKQFSLDYLEWTSETLTLSTQNGRNIFAFQGNVDQITINVLHCEKLSLLKPNLFLYTTWLRGFHYSKKHTTTVKIKKYKYVTEFPVIKGKYHFVKLSDHRLSLRAFISWNEASEYCKNISGHLPRFFSRHNQEEFISLLKTSSDIFVTPAIYIDLKIMNSASR